MICRRVMRVHLSYHSCRFVRTRSASVYVAALLVDERCDVFPLILV